MHKRTTLTEWDWHYRVGFDCPLARRVAEAAKSIERPEERAILQATLEWSRSFISLDRLLTALQDQELPPSAVEDLVPSKLLHLPSCLASSFALRIGRLADRLGSELGRKIEGLLTAALANPYQPRAHLLFEAIFKDGLEPLLRRAAATPLSPHPGFEPLSPDEAKAQVSAFLRQATSDPMFRRTLAMASLQVRYTTEPSGYGEYWPRVLSPGQEQDLLVLHLNGQSLDRLALDATLYHEIFGHGSFYAILQTGAPSFTDHGAFILVEGWATAWEWRCSDPAYAAWTRSRRLLHLSHLNATADDLIAQIDAAIDEEAYSLNREARLIDLFQYPGLSASYAIGGLYFESAGPDAMKMFGWAMRHRPWGDFMAAWNHIL